MFTPQAKYDDEWINLRDLGTEGQVDDGIYNLVTGAWFMALGGKLDINREWSINVEIGVRKSWSDYLDDVSTVYPNYALLRAEHGQIAVDLADPSIPNAEGLKLGTEGTQRGDSRTKDGFTTLGVSLLYYFGNIDCPNLSLPAGY